MSILKLPGTLNIASGSYFTPINEATESSGDQDLASGGVMLLPDGLSTAFPHLLVAGGKDGTKYVLNRDRLGGQQTGDAGAVWQAVTGGLMWGGPSLLPRYERKVVRAVRRERRALDLCLYTGRRARLA